MASVTSHRAPGVVVVIVCRVSLSNSHLGTTSLCVARSRWWRRLLRNAGAAERANSYVTASNISLPNPKLACQRNYIAILRRRLRPWERGKGGERTNLPSLLPGPMRTKQCLRRQGGNHFCTKGFPKTFWYIFRKKKTSSLGKIFNTCSL